MTDYQDLHGTRFERVNLREAAFTDVYLNDAQVRDVDLTGAEFRLVRFMDVRMRNVELVNVDISGELSNLVINGVDVAAFVEAELDRRMPERAKMRPTTVEGFREAFEILDRLWAETIERARALPEEAVHTSVDDEWSLVQTVRHLAFASGCWVDRMVLGEPAPWRPGELPWDEAPTGDWFVWDRDAKMPLDEALALRDARRATVRDLLARLTDEDLDRTVTRTEPGHPRQVDMPVGECLRVVLREWWEHRSYAERDLALIEQGVASRS